MKFRIYEYFETHPLQKRIAKWWAKKGFPLPERMKRQIVNQIHAEMIARLMSVVVEKGSITVEQALHAQYELGQEIAVQIVDFLSVASDDARHLSSIIDFLHGLLDIGDKVEVVRNQQEVICHWKKCFLSEQLKTSKDGGGPYYCHLYQEMYKGVLHGINPQAKANTLTIIQSLGHQYCELRTWIE